MAFLETLKSITLSDNVFECTCESKGLWEFLHSNMVEAIVDSANVTVVCDGVPLHLVDIELADICTDVKEVIIYYVLPFILLLLLVLGRKKKTEKCWHMFPPVKWIEISY